MGEVMSGNERELWVPLKAVDRLFMGARRIIFHQAGLREQARPMPDVDKLRELVKEFKGKALSSAIIDDPADQALSCAWELAAKELDALIGKDE